MKKTTRSAVALIACLGMMTLSAVTATAAPPLAGVEVLPDYSKPLLTPASQAGAGFSNVIPNALAGYYTYVPYSNAAAALVGFGAGTNCGNLAVNTPADQASTEDCYTISVRKFTQQLSLAPVLKPTLQALGLAAAAEPQATTDSESVLGKGLVKRDGTTPFRVTTSVYGYGSGGVDWPVTGAQGNAPTPLFSGDNPLSVANGVWHFPAPTIWGTKDRKVRVQWINEIPPNDPPVGGVDPTNDCGMGTDFCYPYNRMVVHVHGAHVGPESDGFAQAWFTDSAWTAQAGFTAPGVTGPLYQGGTNNVENWAQIAGPVNTNLYPLDQEASTIWYHDHAMGVTHTNTQMGMAGFFPITDNNEKYLQGLTVTPDTLKGELTPAQMPGPKLLPTGRYELGFALQDRRFSTDGQFAMPDYPIYDLKTGTGEPGAPAAIAFDPVTGAPLPCTLLENGLANPATCKRLDFMYSSAGADAHLIPYVDGDPLLANANNANAPYPAVSTTLEYFGNMPVVNGSIYGNYTVEPQVYRMRFIGGTDSRTWVFRIQRDDTGTFIPMYQIAAEQGFFNAPVLRDNITLMPGERADILVDLRNVPVNIPNSNPAVPVTLSVVNYGPDGPWDGFNDGIAAPVNGQEVISADIPTIFKFVMGTDLVYGTVLPAAGVSIPAGPEQATGLVGTTIQAAITNLRPVLGTLTGPAASGNPIRNLALEEITDEFGRTMPTIDARGFLRHATIPVTEVMKFGDTEDWDIINNTVDAHPMHVHLVAFKVLGRAPFSNFVPAVSDATAGVFKEPSYTATAAFANPDGWDDGWKDTVFTPPGFVTRIRATFDVQGLYVWHCHILSHEEHDMMRSMRVEPSLTNVSFSTAPPAAVATNAGTIALNAAVTGLSSSASLGSSAVAEYRYSYRTPAGSGTYSVVPGCDYSTHSNCNMNISAVAGGTYDIKVDARHLGSRSDSEVSATASTAITVSLNITTASLGSYTIGNGEYNDIVLATGGTKPYTFSLLSGSLPPGVGVFSNGQIWGVPTVPGTYNFTVQVTDSAASPATTSHSYTIVVSPTTPLSITTASPLAGYTIGSGEYNNIITATGGVAPYSFSVPTGTVPPGVGVFSNGQVWGVPTVPGNYSFTVRATDAAAFTQDQPFTLQVLPSVALSVATATLPDYSGTGEYNQIVTAVGGVPPYTFAATGTVPPGTAVFFNGQVWGVPNTPGTYNFTVTVTDAMNITSNQSYTVIVP